MKYRLLLFLIFFISKLTYSQDSIAPEEIRNPHPGFSLSLAGGLSPGFGLLSFDNDDDTWNGGECAGWGGAININGDYRFKKHVLELTASIGYNHNNYDVSNLISYLNDPGGQSLSVPASNVFNASATAYNTWYFSAGIKYPIDAGRFTFYFDFMPAMLICHTPAISFTLHSDTVPYNVTQPENYGFAYSLRLDAGVEYHINKNIFVLICGGIGVAINPVRAPVNTSIPLNSGLFRLAEVSSWMYLQTDNLEMGVGYEF